MTDLNAMREDISKAQEVAIRARSSFERAEEDRAKAEQELEELGLDISQPLEPQLDRLRTAAEQAMQEVREKQRQVEEAMA